MKTTKEYQNFVLEQLDLLENIFCRPMMGEYLLYYNNILFGGIYENRLLIKKTTSNIKYNLKEEIPYKGAKPMFYITNLEDKQLLKQIIIDTCQDLINK